MIVTVNTAFQFHIFTFTTNSGKLRGRHRSINPQPITCNYSIGLLTNRQMCEPYITIPVIRLYIIRLQKRQ